MAEESFADRTEQATPRRREEARKKGQVAKSREIPSVAILVLGMSTIFFLGTYIYQKLSEEMVNLLKNIAKINIGFNEIKTLNNEIIWYLFKILSPLFLVLLGVSILSHQVQTRFLFSLEPLRLDFGKINPISGLKRIIGKHGFIELLKSVLKFLIIAMVGYFIIKKEVDNVLLLIDQNLGQIFKYISSVSLNLLLKISSIITVLAILDYIYQRWNYESQLKMTRYELKEEMKLTEGDPLIKSRIRSIQRHLARSRMMAEVPKADVVITNPTHLAVALYYRSKEMKAPKVIAKGAGWIAEKIIEIARLNQIIIVENKFLAQTLYRNVDIGQIIPSDLYQAVADILAYVYKIKNKVWW
ncbi:MAG: flagellar biosynthesis protein FlhB [Candidatus Jordarchaeum sp.]|uniref:flagellar biosynthesis protein FlhB n=1 Tax=Candidatus Jordarchaeum sp. TaxID=2823881 RepID=UPI00404B72A3